MRRKLNPRNVRGAYVIGGKFNKETDLVVSGRGLFLLVNLMGNPWITGSFVLTPELHNSLTPQKVLIKVSVCQRCPTYVRASCLRTETFKVSVRRRREPYLPRYPRTS